MLRNVKFVYNNGLQKRILSTSVNLNLWLKCKMHPAPTPKCDRGLQAHASIIFWFCPKLGTYCSSMFDVFLPLLNSSLQPFCPSLAIGAPLSSNSLRLKWLLFESFLKVISMHITFQGFQSLEIQSILVHSKLTIYFQYGNITITCVVLGFFIDISNKPCIMCLLFHNSL